MNDDARERLIEAAGAGAQRLRPVEILDAWTSDYRDDLLAVLGPEPESVSQDAARTFAQNEVYWRERAEAAEARAQAAEARVWEQAATLVEQASRATRAEAERDEAIGAVLQLSSDVAHYREAEAAMERRFAQINEEALNAATSDAADALEWRATGAAMLRDSYRRALSEQEQE